ncbi:trimeric intracellular cation channel family protein [Serratia surfactantfaciens]|uniref:trimeric intracellular cation channel family protein n=1 Tax=Serratia surfactantfaciens TaxID=2741499 RepID=UPI0018E46947|nr:trimeric intracellular cation channel family protein [Serratia surfactantfaciens]MBI6152205.1 trimeric intracellular cation channel family protein [Serratia surfactantfaciens]
MESHIDIFHLIDIIGTFVFALSGAIIGVKKNFDIFGVFVISYVTAIGGGVMRDVCITNDVPVGLISNEYFVDVCLAVFSILFLKKIVLSFEKSSLFFDAIGLGFFASFGAHKSYMLTGNIHLSIIMGCTTAIGGGIIRDILTGKQPTIFTQELYASPAILGAGIQLLGSTGLMNIHVSGWLAIISCTLLRMLAIKYNIKLPPIRDIGF